VSFWESVAARGAGVYTAEELETTAYRLVAEQAIYYSDHHSRNSYWMIDQYEGDYKKVLDPLGISLTLDRNLRFAIAVPTHVKGGVASVASTVLALVLRAIYDESARAGQMTEDGEVICDLIVLDEKYRLMSGRELPHKSRLDTLMDTMKRWGIAKIQNEGEPGISDAANLQPYVVCIRPAIVHLLGETALARLTSFKIAKALGSDDEADAEENTNTEGLQE
jgi:hypothetical protein